LTKKRKNWLKDCCLQQIWRIAANYSYVILLTKIVTLIPFCKLWKQPFFFSHSLTIHLFVLVHSWTKHIPFYLYYLMLFGIWENLKRHQNVGMFSINILTCKCLFGHYHVRFLFVPAISSYFMSFFLVSLYYCSFYMHCFDFEKFLEYIHATR
jgi:hypothetical protein